MTTGAFHTPNTQKKGRRWSDSQMDLEYLRLYLPSLKKKNNIYIYIYLLRHNFHTVKEKSYICSLVNFSHHTSVASAFQSTKHCGDMRDIREPRAVKRTHISYVSIISDGFCQYYSRIRVADTLLAVTIVWFLPDLWHKVYTLL